MVIGFIAEKPLVALIVGGIPILLFFIFSAVEIDKKNVDGIHTKAKSNKNSLEQFMYEPPKPIDKTHALFKFEQNHDAYLHRMNKQEHKYPLVAGAEFLLEKGFVFCRAIADGGINEIGHTGDTAYFAEYIDFIDFRDNFEKDMDEAEKYEMEHSGGWVSSLNYGYITIYLKNDEMRVSISVDRSTVFVNWYDVSDSKNLIFEELNQKILKIIGYGVTLNKETCFKDECSDQFEKNHRSKWDIHYRIEYWLNDDSGGVVREISPFEFEYLRKGEIEWVKLQQDNSFEREVYLGQGNNCLTRKAPEEAEQIIKEWLPDVKLDTITVIK